MTGPALEALREIAPAARGQVAVGKASCPAGPACAAPLASHGPDAETYYPGLDPRSARNLAAGGPMYIPAHFAVDEAAVDELLARHGAADLVTLTEDGLLATMLPFAYDPVGGRARRPVRACGPEQRPVAQGPR